MLEKPISFPATPRINMTLASPAQLESNFLQEFCVLSPIPYIWEFGTQQDTKNTDA